MPYTMPHTPTAHIWVEERVHQFDKPLCREPDYTGDSAFDLVRLEERDMDAGRPRTVAEWVLWSEVCRECAEHLADHTDLETAPVQWLKGVGSKRAGALKESGVKTLADVSEYMEEDPDMAMSSPPYLLKTEELAEDTGLSVGVASNLLNCLKDEEWRRETPPGGDEDLRAKLREAEVR